MPATIVVGTQWGDEGKGRSPTSSPRRCRWWCATRAATTPATRSSSTARPSPSSCIPSGVLYDHITPVIGNGVVVDPKVHARRDRHARVRGVDCDKLRLSGNAHLIFPYHQVLDRMTERWLGKQQARHHQAGHRAGLRRQGAAGRHPGPGPLRPEDLPREAPRRAARDQPGAGQGLQPAARRRRRDRRLVPRHVPRRHRALRRRHREPGPRGASRPASTSSSRAPRPPSSTSTTAPIPTSPRRTPSPAAPAPAPASAPATSSASSASPRRTSPGSGRGPFPTELFDELGDTHRRHRPRVRRQHQAPPPPRLVRRRDDAPRRAPQLAVRAGHHQARRPRHASTRVKVCVAYEVDGERIDRMPDNQSVIHKCTPDLRGAARLEDRPHRVDRAPPAPRADAKTTSGSSRSSAACPIHLLGVGPGRDQYVQLAS